MLNMVYLLKQLLILAFSLVLTWSLWVFMIYLAKSNTLNLKAFYFK